MRFGLPFFAGLVQVDFLRAEGKRLAVAPESDDLQAKCPGIELARRRDTFDGQHQVVEVIYLHSLANLSDINAFVNADLSQLRRQRRLHAIHQIVQRNLPALAGAAYL